MKNFTPIRGTNDYLPRDAKLRELVKEKILTNYQNNGYNLISTPILEHLELLNSSEGGDNLKLMFKTVKRGDKLDLTKPNLTESDIVEEGLRYDLTVPLCRFYSNNKDKLILPFKAIQIGNAFRAERPQRGRERQFIQCDIDVIGDPSINAELELLKTALDTYVLLGFEDLTVKINSREILNSIILFSGFNKQDIGTVCVTLDKIDKISIEGVMMELIEKGFETEKINKLIDIIAETQKSSINCLIKYGVEDKIIAELNYLINNLVKLTSNKINIVFDISIVRGQGYYTGAVYEIYTNGFAGAIGGGGRYDNMIEKFSGNKVCAVGVSIGFEPLCMLIKERNISIGSKQNLALIYDETNNIIDVYKAKDELKKLFNVSLFLKPKNMKNFYEKCGEVVDAVITYTDYIANKQVKYLD